MRPYLAELFNFLEPSLLLFLVCRFSSFPRSVSSISFSWDFAFLCFNILVLLNFVSTLSPFPSVWDLKLTSPDWSVSRDHRSSRVQALQSVLHWTSDLNFKTEQKSSQFQLLYLPHFIWLPVGYFVLSLSSTLFIPCDYFYTDADCMQVLRIFSSHLYFEVCEDILFLFYWIRDSGKLNKNIPPLLLSSNANTLHAHYLSCLPLLYF